MKYLGQKFHRCSALIVFIIAAACSTVKEEKVFTQQQVATAWGDMALYITKNTPANSPTFASRGFGYIGVTMYESIVHGYPNYKTLAGQLNGLADLPSPEPHVD